MDDKRQICIEEVLDKKVITIKLSSLLIILVISVSFSFGVFTGWIGKDDSMRKSQRFGYNSAILDYPGAGLAQANKPFCYDGNGNYHRTKKINNWNFQITRDQSLPELKPILDEQIFKRNKPEIGGEK